MSSQCNRDQKQEACKDVANNSEFRTHFEFTTHSQAQDTFPNDYNERSADDLSIKILGVNDYTVLRTNGYLRDRPSRSPSSRVRSYRERAQWAYGGSLRAPAGNCGLCTSESTGQGVPLRRSSYDVIGSGTFIAYAGSKSLTFDSVNLFIKTVLGPEPLKSEPALHQIPRRHTERYCTRAGNKTQTNWVSYGTME